MITLRPSLPADAAAVAACVDVVARERRYLAHVCGFSVEETRSFLTSFFTNGGVQFVVHDGDALVGWCDASPVQYEGMRHVARLGIGLLPAYRHQGLGKKLLHETLRRAFAGDLSRIELEVFSNNVAAIRLYERTGFVIEGRKRQARALDGVVEDILIMGLLRNEWSDDGR
jgi:RimJ/RimL family protein N-acetyltransferase